MAVGHGGDESKHPAWVKIAILEFIEARFKDIVENDQDLKDEFRAKLIDYLADCGVELSETEIKSIVDKKVADYYVKVYDPFSTDMDFYIFFNVDWPKYLDLYHKYYKEDTPNIQVPEEHLNAVFAKYDPGHRIHGYTNLIRKAIRTTGSETVIDEVFNASRSRSVIFYTIQQMKNILELGHP
jgi:hypothetical protein